MMVIVSPYDATSGYLFQSIPRFGPRGLLTTRPKAHVVIWPTYDAQRAASAFPRALLRCVMLPWARLHRSTRLHHPHPLG